MLNEWQQLACQNPWGKWLLVLVVIDKVLELILGELARRQKIEHGSLLGLLCGIIFMVFLFSINIFKKKEETK